MLRRSGELKYIMVGSDCINEILKANDRLWTTSETRFKNRVGLGVGSSFGVVAGFESVVGLGYIYKLTSPKEEV